ncbi:TBC1 domain family member 5 homolog A isoform X2 [Eupeodes corollae]|uniref:TBC1 domain family member 5 homolog A isoform X2 n=1 Tax=Eupeodes corollae TaxID=290404 RepID=UPI00249186E9|nr:TBC1 domain family member 5 homolog A isoform X2 [Eupeodes corollae]
MADQGIEAIKVFPQQQQQQLNNQESIMNSMDRYRNEWTQIIASLENFDAIRDLAFNGDLKVSKFRSIYWALLLRVLNADHTTWKEQRVQQRNRYEKLKQEFVKNPHTAKFNNDDPLSQSKQSIWNQYFSDQELFAVIKQDVIRTFPGVEFFRKPLIQSAMTNILFYYAREHPYMCYRQGMHEILAPILFVMYGDHQALLHFMELSEDIDELLRDVLSPEHLEADSYSIFSRLMASIESYYRITNLTQTDGGYFPVENDQDILDPVTTEVEVISQLNLIRDKILAKEDLHLHNYLLKLDIPLHIFGIRWLRLLFGREFPLLDLLMLWDAIFADSDRFDLPNYILVAMLIRIRDKLLLNDYTTCLTYLMRYPTNVDINLILRHALHMQSPKKFDRPPNAFIYFTMNTETAQSSQYPASSSSSQIKSVVPGSAPTMRKVLPHSQITHLGPNEKRRQRSSSLSNDNLAAIARLKATPESDKVIIDGYSENSPELLSLKLKNAQNIINFSKNKLQNYLDTVKKHLPPKPSDELGRALDGIEELCSFLDAQIIFPNYSRTTQIDQALEADESRQFKSMSPEIKTINENNITVPQLTKTFDPRVQESRQLEEVEIVSNGGGRTAYEKPDTGYMVNSFRLLGNRKEVELIAIATDEKADQVTSLSGMPSIDPVGCRDD